MLRNPDPNDWLMIRHDYHANNYSTLSQVTTGNVKDLQLQWVWAMNEGTNQPAPVVHVVAQGDHSFKLSRKDPAAQAAIYAGVQRAIVEFIREI